MPTVGKRCLRWWIRRTLARQHISDGMLAVSGVQMVAAQVARMWHWLAAHVQKLAISRPPRQRSRHCSLGTLERAVHYGRLRATARACSACVARFQSPVQ